MKATNDQAKEAILSALVAEQYNRKAAALRLGISVSTLYRTMWQVGLLDKTGKGRGRRRSVV